MYCQVPLHLFSALIQTASDTPSVRKIPAVDQPITHDPNNITEIA